MVEGPDVQTVALQMLALTSIGLAVFAAARDVKGRRLRLTQSLILTALAVLGTVLFFGAGVIRIAFGAPAEWPGGWTFLVIAGALTSGLLVFPLRPNRRIFSVAFGVAGVLMLVIALLARARVDDPGALSPWFAFEVFVIWCIAAAEMVASLRET